jgi:hypothetical protein
MAKFVLTNDVLMGGNWHNAGKVLDDAIHNLAQFRAAGGLLVAATAEVLAQAAAVTNRKLRRGAHSVDYSTTDYVSPLVQDVNPAPAVSGATHVTTAGGTTTISGAGFVSGAVAFLDGGTGALATAFVSASTLTATVPAKAAGSYAVTVINPDGGAGSLPGGLSVTAPPTVTSASAVTPAGGTSHVVGTLFVSGCTATVSGGIGAVACAFVNATHVDLTIPAHGSGTFDVTITNPNGDAGTGAGALTISQPAPTFATISPNVGSAAGGIPTRVNVTGTGFSAGGLASATLGGVAVTGLVVDSDTAAHFAPGVGAAASGVDVVLTGPGGSSVGGNAAWTYLPAGYVVHLRADLGVTLNGGNVSAWADQSGAGNNFSQATPLNQPAFNAADAQYGTKPSVGFDGATSTLGSTAAVSYGNFTVFLAARGETSGGYFYTHDAVSGNTTYMYTTTASSIAVVKSGTLDGKNLSVNWGVTATPQTLMHRYGGTDATHKLWINGADQVLTNQGAPADPGSGASSKKFWLMGDDPAGGFVARNAGTVAEVIVFPAALSDADANVVTAYLRARYGYY